MSSLDELTARIAAPWQGLARHTFFASLANARVSGVVWTIFLEQQMAFLPVYSAACSLAANMYDGKECTELRELLVATSAASIADWHQVHVWMKTRGPLRSTVTLPQTHTYALHLLKSATERHSGVALAALAVCVVAYDDALSDQLVVSENLDGEIATWISNARSDQARKLAARWRTAFNSLNLDGEVVAAFRASVGSETTLLSAVLAAR